ERRDVAPTAASTIPRCPPSLNHNFSFIGPRLLFSVITYMMALVNTKYCIIIPDGAADEPLAELGGKTPLEAAETPNMDRLAALGRMGLARTVPEGFESGSD